MWTKARQQFHRTREHDDSFHILDFPALNLAIFQCMIGIGKKTLDRAQARPAMGVGHDGIRGQGVFHCPLRPNSFNSRSGVDEDTVKIKQKGTTSDCGQPALAGIAFLCRFC
jgi:hypothetical protein